MDATQKLITAYDLCHTWFVRLTTDEEWKHLSNDKDAAAMDRDIDVNTKKYQGWISTESKKQEFMDSVDIN